MTWYSARIIIGIYPVGEENGPINVYENIYLIEAENQKSVIEKAIEYGKSEESVDDKITVDGKAATRFFAGVRNITNVSNPYPLDLDKDRPTTGTEVAYSVFEVQGMEELNKLVREEPVTLRYIA